jgi:hypothetical protein
MSPNSMGLFRKRLVRKFTPKPANKRNPRSGDP